MPKAPRAAIRAAIYARVSKDSDGRSRSVGQQEKANRQACADNGWTIAAVFEDNDRSASRFASKARQDWLRLVTELDARKFDILVMWEPSRGSRDLEVWAALLRVCRDRAVQLYITSHGRSYDPGNARDWRSLAEDAVDSAFESEKTSQRVRRSTLARAEEGRTHSFVPYGWRREFLHGADGRVIGSRDVIAEDEAAVIRDATRQVIAGSSLRSVATALNARGSRSPRGNPWDSTTVREVIARQRNAGRRVHRGEVIGPGTWEPIVSGDDLDRLVAILKDPARKPAHGVPAGLAVQARYLLSGIARCGATLKKGPRVGEICGGTMRVLKNPRTGRLSYSCASCFGAKRRVDLVDELITTVVVARLARPDALAAMASSDADVAELAGRRDALQARMDIAADEFAAGTIDARALTRITGHLRPAITALNDQIRAASAAPDLVDLARTDIGAVWADVPLERKRAVIDALMVITITPVGTGKAWDPESVRIEWRTP